MPNPNLSRGPQLDSNRPEHIELRSESSTSITRPLRSPRLHVAGEIPPELSPLDAFALQSRLLARQLEETVTKDGHRISRLPPLTTASPLVVQARSDYFRSMSQEGSPDEDVPVHPGLGFTTEVEDAFDTDNRPVSMHPRMSRIPPTPDEAHPIPTPSPLVEGRGRAVLGQIDEHEAYFGARREQSPSPLEPLIPPEEHASSKRENLPNMLPSPGMRACQQSPDRLSQKASFEVGALQPPRAIYPSRRPSSNSIVSSPDDAMTSSLHSLPPRKMSASSAGFSSAPAMHRSPSVASESSALLRPSFNFSRLISRSGTPTLEPHLPVRQASSDSQPPFLGDDMTTPVSMHSESFDHPDNLPGAPSYIYSKFALPRGKILQRTIPLERNNTWDPPTLNPCITSSSGAPPSPPTRPSTSGGRFEEPAWSRAALNPHPSPNPSQRSVDVEASEEAPRGRSATMATHEPPRLQTANSATTIDSARTLKAARSQHSRGSTAAEMTPDDHLAKGIGCHEKGSLNESTYHLRHAAMGNNPTGMLLYALACRHGWGMRPNQAEGVRWLKKAAEFASVEIADIENLAKEGKFVDSVDRRTRKAQFALSIYELGVSHMNGWGIEQDKPLGLRCFEIAGTWGDVDALAEAGFCYAKGIGCKKDLKKSAKFYREAEANGMSMVGNSWIHKSKYDEDGGETKNKRTRSKSKSRTIFGLKSSSS